MANFPSSLPSYTGFTSSETLQAAGHASQHNLEQGDITAIATKVGTGASTPTTGNLLRGNGAGTSTWAQAQLSTDVTGVLAVANGGTGTGTSTGTGSVVLNSAPTTSNETATNLTSTHLNNSSGLTNTGGLTTDTQTITGNATVSGTLGVTGATTLASLVLNGSLTGTGLGSQVSTQANAGTAGGNMWWINLGGIKILWAQTLNATATTSYTVTLPTFFTTIQAYLEGVVGFAGTTTGLYIVSCTTATLTYYSGTNPGNGTCFLIVGT